MQRLFFTLRQEIIAVLKPVHLQLPHIVLYKDPRNRWAEERLPLGSGLDRACQVQILAILQEIASCPGGERAREIDVVRMHAEDDDGGLWIPFYDLSSRFDSTQPRHGNVHDDDIRGFGLGKLHCFAAIGGLCNHLELFVLLQLRAQSFSDDAVVIREQDSDSSHAVTLPGTGISRVRAVPPYCRDTTDSLPFTSATRSRMPNSPRPFPEVFSSLNPIPSSSIVTLTDPAEA